MLTKPNVAATSFQKIKVAINIWKKDSKMSLKAVFSIQEQN